METVRSLPSKSGAFCEARGSCKEQADRGVTFRGQQLRTTGSASRDGPGRTRWRRSLDVGIGAASEHLDVSNFSVSTHVLKMKACAVIAVSYAVVWDNFPMWLARGYLDLRWPLHLHGSRPLSPLPLSGVQRPHGTRYNTRLLQCSLPLSSFLSFAPNEQAQVMRGRDDSQQPAATLWESPPWLARAWPHCPPLLTRQEPAGVSRPPTCLLGREAWLVLDEAEAAVLIMLCL